MGCTRVLVHPGAKTLRAARHNRITSFYPIWQLHGKVGNLKLNVISLFLPDHDNVSLVIEVPQFSVDVTTCVRKLSVTASQIGTMYPTHGQAQPDANKISELEAKSKLFSCFLITS